MLKSELKLKNDALIEKTLSFVIEHNSQPYSLWLFQTKIVGSEVMSIDSLRKLFNSLFPDQLRNTYRGKVVNTQLQKEKVRPNVQAPDFLTKDIYGKPINLEQFHGKYLVINFWASWCRPCIKEFPALREISVAYLDEQLEFVFVNQDKDTLMFQKALQKYDLSYGHQISRNQRLRDDYGVRFIPRLILISPKGKVLYTRLSAKDDDQLTNLKQLLDQLINEDG